MAAQIDGIFDDETRKAVLDSKLLVVGAGGIGCELLKNLSLMGFTNIHVIDLDTIDVSNLNRQFLFQKQHVGRSKAVVAKESAQRLNPKCEITAYHDSIINMKYNVNFFEQFSVVANALDNMAARKHVNRMCIAANIPLVESGSAGYLGQVTVHKKGLYECFECIPKAKTKNYPTCTIRNTPSETIHCVVWAKHLFNQLFGEDDPDHDVSPDTTEHVPFDSSDAKVNSPMKSISAREQAKQCNYDAHILFKKFFHDDIQYLNRMAHLWANRRPPTPLVWDELPDAVAGSSGQSGPMMKGQELWSLKECANVFKESLSALRKKVDMTSDGILTWDKDDKACMDFVAASTNLRAYCFDITQESRFKIKSMAGNIVPAIATTNAIVGGLIALQLLNVLKNNLDRCRSVFLNASVTGTRNKLLSSCMLQKANPNCIVCSHGKPEVHIKLNTRWLTIKTLEKILIEQLHMVAPDVVIDDGKGTILLSSDEEEKGRSGIADKTLACFGIKTGHFLQCDDFFQHFKLTLVIEDIPEMVDQDFIIESDLSNVKPVEEEEKDGKTEDDKTSYSGEVEAVEEEDEIVMVGKEIYTPLKRKSSEDENGAVSSKRMRMDSSPSSSADSEIVVA